MTTAIVDSFFIEPQAKEIIQGHLDILSKRDDYTQHSLRKYAIDNYGFAIPCVELIETITSFSKNILEVGSGSGYLSKLLRPKVDHLICTDSGKNGYRLSIGSKFRVVRINAVKAIKRYPEKDVLMSWPCYRSNWSYHAAKAMKPGRYLFYIGEGAYGCTGTDEFHEYLPASFQYIDSCSIPKWWGLHDRLEIYQKS